MRERGEDGTDSEEIDERDRKDGGMEGGETKGPAV